ncbi:MAG TPA: MraY family glycosyltransferase [Streptosporangiaceae bacterium]|nr:MraY family glycosyltransferase [Streptosporangiaceae bacterium]
MREYVLTLLVVVAVTYLLTPLVRLAAIRFRAVIPIRDRDVHATPIPRMGGVAMYLGVAAGLFVGSNLVPLRNSFHGTGLVVGLLGAGGLIVAVGIVDDRWGIGALGKLAGQIGAAAILFASGARLTYFPEPHNGLFSLTQNESVVLTILVVVATINAVNFIDGLDGLAAGIVCIAAISFFIYYYSLTRVVGLSAEAVPALASIVLAGACLGFLPHNFYPAKIIMGDTGSMLLGLLLAYVPIWAINSLDFTSLNNKANRYAEILPLLLPAAVLVIPYVDMLRAVIRRTRAGMSPFAADRKHLHHTMLEIGHSHRQSVLILYAWAALFAGTVVGLSIVTVHLAVLIWITLAAIGALALLSIPKLRWWERTRPVALGLVAEGRSRGGVASGATVTPSASDPGTARPVARGPVGPRPAAAHHATAPHSAAPHHADPHSRARRGAGNGWHDASWQTMPNGVGDHAEAGSQHAEPPAQDGEPIGWSRRNAGP